MKNPSTVPEVLTGRAPLSRPFNVGPGQRLYHLDQKSPETKEEAVQRAQHMMWWKYIVNPMPRLFSNRWVFLGKKPT